MNKITPLPIDNIKTYSLKTRKSKVNVNDFASPWTKSGGIKKWLESLPDILAGKQIKEIVSRFVKAASSDKTIIIGMGGHVIKVGLAPVIIDLMDRRIIKGIAMNGACIIHDSEIAMVGQTSEDVAGELGRGEFGMAEETGRYINNAIAEGYKKGMGLGRAVGAMLTKNSFPFNRYSILARAYELDIPVTVHVAIGTDIIHFHRDANGAAIGATSHLDFRIFSRLISSINGGIYINLGSAVILPEVFLKALTLVRNLGYNVKDFTTVNMDFIQHYRPTTNVVYRPTMEGGKGYQLTGHHELMFPLIAALVIEAMETVKETDS